MKLTTKFGYLQLKIICPPITGVTLWETMYLGKILKTVPSALDNTWEARAESEVLPWPVHNSEPISVETVHNLDLTIFTFFLI